MNQDQLSAMLDKVLAGMRKDQLSSMISDNNTAMVSAARDIFLK